jgi:hypothetical protein
MTLSYPLDKLDIHSHCADHQVEIFVADISKMVFFLVIPCINRVVIRGAGAEQVS